MHQSTESSLSLDMSIRKAAIEDMNAIVRIWLEGQSATSEKISIDELTAFYSPHLVRHSERFGIWIAESRDESGCLVTLGWQALLPCRPQPLFEQYWAQSSTYISNGSRTRGVGRSLLTFICSQAISSGLSHIVGYIRADNPIPIRLVSKLGWQLVGSVPRSSDSDPQLCCYMYAVPPKPTVAGPPTEFTQND